MTFVEQHRMIEDLRGYARRMDRTEQADFEMMMKRDKDEEQLDVLTLRKLQHLHDKYVPKKSRRELDDAWAKLTGGKKPEGE
jgi:hypothetical protein